MPRRQDIEFVREFRYEAYGEHIIPAGSKRRLPINENREAVITVGHGAEIRIPPDYFRCIKKTKNLRDKISDLEKELKHLKSKLD